MYDYIFILGAQGSGKTTVGRLLKEKLHSPFVDFDWIRDFHLNATWSNTSDVELRMSLENLVFLLENYHTYNYKNVVVVGVDADQLNILVEKFKNLRILIVTLVVHEDEILKKRVLTESRDSGFRDYVQSLQLNEKLKEMTIENGVTVDNTNQTPEETATHIMNILGPDTVQRKVEN